MPSSLQGLGRAKGAKESSGRMLFFRAHRSACEIRLLEGRATTPSSPSPPRGETSLLGGAAPPRRGEPSRLPGDAPRLQGDAPRLRGDASPPGREVTSRSRLPLGRALDRLADREDALVDRAADDGGGHV